MKQQLNAFYVENSDGDMELNEGILDNIFDNTTQDCDKNWLDSEFKTWIEWKNLETSFIDAYSYMKLNPVDSDNIKNVVATVKDLINERNNISFDDNFGTDTSDITEYYLETKESFSTGYSWIDSKLGGGLSYKTITVFFGPPKIGKCVTGDSTIIVRNKSTGETLQVTMDEFNNICSNNKNTDTPK